MTSCTVSLTASLKNNFHTSVKSRKNYYILNMKKLVLVLDVDGVLTDGRFLYDANGKAYKEFGPEDADALKMLVKSTGITVVFCSADHRGFEITKKRVNDMGFEVFNIKARDRKQWIEDNYGLANAVYIGDGLVDIPCLDSVKYSFVPASGSAQAKEHCNQVLHCRGGQGAVAEACYEIAQRFYGKTYMDLLKENGYDV